jgi:hypothetical protein
VASHLGADHREVIFVRNATEALNLVAYSWGRTNLEAGDRILVTEMEHHSNVVPWYQVAQEKGAHLDWAPITADGRLDMDAFAALLERGPVERVADVLAQFGPAAKAASPFLARKLMSKKGDDYPKAILEALGAIGPAGSETLEAVEAFYSSQTDDRSRIDLTSGELDRDTDLLAWVIWRLRGQAWHESRRTLRRHARRFQAAVPSRP